MNDARVGGRLALWIAVWAALLFGAGLARAQDLPFLEEYRIKAATLYQFGNYVEWPDNAIPGAGSTFVIGILGEDPFGAALETTVRGRSIHKKRIVIRRFPEIDDLLPCHILFISRSEERRLPEIFRRLRGARTLTVSEIVPFLRRGGMIRLVTEDKRVRFEINPGPARWAKLKISARLLRLSNVPLGRRRR